MFKKLFNDVTDQEWDDIYQQRAAKNIFLTPSIHDGASLKQFMLLSYAEENKVFDYVDSKVREYNKKTGRALFVDFGDIDRDYLYDQSKSANPDILIYDEKNEIIETVEVKNLNALRTPLAFNYATGNYAFVTSYNVNNSTMERANLSYNPAKRLKKHIIEKLYHKSRYVAYANLNEAYFVDTNTLEPHTIKIDETNPKRRTNIHFSLDVVEHVIF